MKLSGSESFTWWLVCILSNNKKLGKSQKFKLLFVNFLFPETSSHLHNITHSWNIFQRLLWGRIAQAPCQIYHWVIQQKGVAHFIPCSHASLRIRNRNIFLIKIRLVILLNVQQLEPKDRASF